jgi:hypothetical protein
MPNGHLVRTRRLEQPGQGSTLQAGGAGGGIEIVDWDGDIIWEYDYFVDGEYRHHHDFERLPNGNILLVAWEVYSEAEAAAAGRQPNRIPEGGVWSEHVVEIQPDLESGTGEIVWRWHAWDHLGEGVGQVDINAGGRRSDWLHINSIDYHPELDQIMLSVHNLQEVWIVDHSTTTQEAADVVGGDSGQGGEILYRWGNPQVYGFDGSQQLYGQHDAQWIVDPSPGAGNVLIFNNGNQDDRPYSTVDEIVLPPYEGGHFARQADAPFGPVAPVWRYEDRPEFFSANISGAQRLPNGNTLICQGADGRLFEVTAGGDVVWEYHVPRDLEPGGSSEMQEQPVFRATRYPPDYAGFDGREL